MTKRTYMTEARQAKGWSMRDLAERLGVDKGYISNLESGKRNPSLQTAWKLSKLLNFDVELFAPKHENNCPECGVDLLKEGQKACHECGHLLQTMYQKM